MSTTYVAVPLYREKGEYFGTSEMARAHRGTIGVASDETRTVFTFTMPR